MIEIIDQIKTAVDSVTGNNQFAQGGLLIAAASWLFYQMKSLPLMIYNSIVKLFIFQVNITYDHDDNTYELFSKWYLNKYPEKYQKTVAKIEFEKSIDPWDYDYSSKKRRLVLNLYQGSDLNLIYYKGRLLYVRKIRNKLEHATSSGDLYSNEYIISGLFAKKIITQMLNEIKDQRQAELVKATGIKLVTNSNSGTHKTNLDCFKTFDQLWFDEKQRLINYLDNWNARKEHSKRMGIIHKTGISLYGPPGTGKTSIAKAIAHRYNLDLVMINLSNFKTDADLTEFITDQSGDSAFLFEDVDDFLGKTNRSKMKGNSMVSFSCLLQIFDGVLSPNNSIFILTTNHVEELDPAIYRDGRINFRANIGYPGIPNIKQFLESYYNTKINTELKLKSVLSMATIEQTILKCDSIEECLKALSDG